MKKAIVVDLDGTLLAANTFRDYLKFSYGEAFRTLHLQICCLLLFYAILRILRLISHAKMKYYILKITQNFVVEERIDRFVDLEMKKVRAEVIEILEEHKRIGSISILATAAPENYALPLSKRFYFDDCCATPIVHTAFVEWHENKGTEKLKNVLNILEKRHAQLDVVVTDHKDDLPLLNANHKGKNIIWKS